MSQIPIPLAKLTWTHPQSGQVMEFVLCEGSTASIGRQASNDICIPEQHVSRQHAVIRYQDGVFMIADLGSANGTFVNDMQLTQAYPLMTGDIIRLYVPQLTFSAALEQSDLDSTNPGSTLIGPAALNGQGKLIISTGPQEGHTVPLLLDKLTVGRATSSATWEIMLQDPSVSRPHARLERINEVWVVFDLGSANGTLVNGNVVTEKGRSLRDGDTISFGKTLVLFRSA